MAEEPEKASEKSQPTYSLEEVAEHNSSESLWLAIDGKVYDVTEFMEEVRLHACLALLDL